MRSSLVRVGGASVALAVAILPLSAQTLFTYDHNGGNILEYHGGSDPCGDAITPLSNSFAPDMSCGGAQFAGTDVAYNSATDEVYWASDTHISVHAATGAYLRSFASPIPVRGMGVDANLGVIWATDGAQAFAIDIPGAGCGPTTVASVVQGPVTIPVADLWMDIDWDPVSETLWACGVFRNVVNFDAGGSLAQYGSVQYPTCSGSPFGLRGIAVDTTSFLDPGPGHVYVSDGFNVGSYLPGGVLTPAGSWSFPAPCTPNPVPVPTRGLAFAARGVNYGTGVDLDGLPAPVCRAVGASVIPNAAFGFELEDAAPGSMGYLVLGDVAACPPWPFLGMLLYHDFTANYVGTYAVEVVGPSGTAFGSVPIGNGDVTSWAYGRNYVAQWLILKPSGFRQTSNATYFRFGVR